MMADLIDIEEYRAHLLIQGDKFAHIIPRAFFEDVVSGKRSIDDLDDRDDILKRIISEWLVIT